MGFLGELLAAKNNFQATQTPLAQTNYQPGLEQGIGNQQALVQALQQQMQGGGPNLGQTQLQSALNQQNQQSAGLIAGQRGLNPQLAARQILQNNAQNNQAASNQSAQLQQQQQLATQGQLGNLVSNQVGQLGGLQNAQNALNVQQSLGVQGINEGVASQNQQAANNFLPSLLGAASGAGQAATKIGKLFSEGGQVSGEVPVLVSPGEKVIPPGGSAQDGGIVPGQAKVKGDSPKNDTVPALLKPGSMVIPRTVLAEDQLNPGRVAEFMAAVRKPGYAKVVEAKKKWKGGKV